MNFLVKLLLIAILVGFHPAVAQEVGVGLWCDTKEQVAEFLKTVENNARATLEKVNAAHGENACVISYVLMHRGNVVASVRNRNGTWDITEILVVGVGVDGRMVPVEPKVFFTGFKRAGKDI